MQLPCPTVAAKKTLPFPLQFVQFARLKNAHKTEPEPVPFNSVQSIVLYCIVADLASLQYYLALSKFVEGRLHDYHLQDVWSVSG